MGGRNMYIYIGVLLTPSVYDAENVDIGQEPNQVVTVRNNI